MKNKINSLKFAQQQGNLYATILQPKFWVGLATVGTELILGLFFRISTIEWYLINFAFGFLLYAELFSLDREKVVLITQPGIVFFTEQIK